MLKTLVHKYFIVADAPHLYSERAIVAVEHLRGNLNPLVFEIAQWQVVYDYPLAALPCVAGVDYLNTAVVPAAVAACAYCDQRCAVVPLLGFQLVDVAEFCAGAEPLWQLELPLQHLCLADVAVQMLPLLGCLAFHLVPLAVVPLAPVTVKMCLVGMERETEDILPKRFVEDNFAVSAVGVVIGRYVGVFGIVPPRSVHKGVYLFVALARQSAVCTQRAFQRVCLEALPVRLTRCTKAECRYKAYGTCLIHTVKVVAWRSTLFPETRPYLL